MIGLSKEDIRQSLQDREKYIKLIKSSNLEESVKKVLVALIKATFG